ncbi:hypothetical protein EV182_002633 [Spiromyces aspiralis]|uniref:Uncharacterized protein n=1 Tax=Spiromyces aspiralis TaxID=68401 RepID=A0ACC1HVM8_9FUNG|nr:hypothetical protein EV182_002633 [Spiromyces aspiralis]
MHHHCHRVRIPGTYSNPSSSSLIVTIIFLAVTMLTIRPSLAVQLPPGAKSILQLAQNNTHHKLDDQAILAPLLDYAEAISCTDSADHLRWSTRDDNLIALNNLMDCTFANLASSQKGGEFDDARDWALIYTWLYLTWYDISH